MLKRLNIYNYALIKELDVVFPENLTVITGETGAGKSIFLDALGLVLGNRAESGILGDTSKKCVVEAVFEAEKLDVKSFFEKNDLDFDKSVVLRREISSEGKSRCFINDSLVSLSLLRELSSYFVDVHSQHENLFINQGSFQLNMIDSFAENKTLLKEYSGCFLQLQNLTKELEGLRESSQKNKREEDYYSFLLKELEGFNYKNEDILKKEAEIGRMENSVKIKEVLSSLYSGIEGGENDLVSIIRDMTKRLSGIIKYSEDYTDVQKRLEAALVEIKDISATIYELNENLEFEPEKLFELNSELDKINKLFIKHGVKTAEELISIKDEIVQKLEEIEGVDEKIKELEKKISGLKKSCGDFAEELSKRRKGVVYLIEKEINETLPLLGLNNSKFKIIIEKTGALTISGQDTVEFLFSANKGQVEKEISKVASGGEISRLMLAIKATLARRKQLPSIIFDEIDTGISGEVADKMGKIFLGMSQYMQVVCITHLPQIASKGKHHLFVFKDDSGEKTQSLIKELKGEERIVEIAKMLSSGKPGESAIKNAKDLLGVN